MHTKKSLGQNYLVDINIIKKIINLKQISNKNVLEIGPGKGALTNHILKMKPRSLILVEKDNFLFQELKLKYKEYKNVLIYNEDILKFNFEKKLKDKSVIFGNLPYNISSQILVKIIRLKRTPPKYSDIIFMFQKEMAERIIGKFNTSKYGRLSIISNYKLNVLTKFNVSPNCFFPKPKIYSTVLHLRPRKKKIFNILKIENLEKVTNTLFSNKRKMINKNIKKILDNDQINLIHGLNLNLRPSDLKPEVYYKITELFEQD